MQARPYKTYNNKNVAAATSHSLIKRMTIILKDRRSAI